jgi:hypothetical protein
MDKSSITPGAGSGAGELTTFYAYDSGAARSLVLANMAWLLAGPQHGSVPVLMIDWDLASPGLHLLFGSGEERPGLLEFFEACRDQPAGMPADAEARAQHVLGAVDWRDYIERVDTGRPLYLLRAGRIDAGYDQRADRLDWHALFRACPALLRQWRAQLAATFRHVFIDAPCGRSDAVSVCTSLLPDKLVGLFAPARRSLDGLCGVVERAITYRCSHEEEQRPLLLYPLPCSDGNSGAAARVAWRRGGAQPGYQRVLETLMEASYGRAQLSLESYFDTIHLPPVDAAGADCATAGADPDRLASGRTLLALLDWFADGYFPWQLHGELMLLRHLATAPASAQCPAFGAHAAHAEQAMPALHVADAVEAQLDYLQQLVDRQALREARTVADRLRHLMLCPAVAYALRSRGAALIELVYRHDNASDALLSFTQDELASLKQARNDTGIGRPLAYL